MERHAFQNLRVYLLCGQIADAPWIMIAEWTPFARDTIGKQLVRAGDSIAANITEGADRGSYQDNRRFVKIARGSLNETPQFLRPAHCRGLVSAAQATAIGPLLNELGPKLNAYLRSIGAIKPTSKNNGQLTTDN